MSERLIRCDVCGADQRHVLVGPHWEQDNVGRYHRYECCGCKAHHKIYEDQDVTTPKPSRRAKTDEHRVG